MEKYAIKKIKVERHDQKKGYYHDVRYVVVENMDKEGLVFAIIMGVVAIVMMFIVAWVFRNYAEAVAWSFFIVILIAFMCDRIYEDYKEENYIMLKVFDKLSSAQEYLDFIRNSGEEQ